MMSKDLIQMKEKTKNSRSKIMGIWQHGKEKMAFIKTRRFSS